MSYKSEQIVKWLADTHANVRAGGFRKALRAEVTTDEDVHHAARRFIPDAYAILPETREVHVIEVVDTCPITFDKGAWLHEFGAALDDLEWTVSIVAFDYTGGLIAHLPFYCFCPVVTDVFKGQEIRDVLPAAMAVYRAGRSEEPSAYGPHRWLPRAADE